MYLPIGICDRITPGGYAVQGGTLLHSVVPGF